MQLSIFELCYKIQDVRSLLYVSKQFRLLNFARQFKAVQDSRTLLRASMQLRPGLSNFAIGPNEVQDHGTGLTVQCGSGLSKLATCVDAVQDYRTLPCGSV